MATKSSSKQSWTVAEFIEYALPGARRHRARARAADRSRLRAPDWPPDLFAVAALLLERLDLLAYWDGSDESAVEKVEAAAAAGCAWRDTPDFETSSEPEAERGRELRDELWGELSTRFGGYGLDGVQTLPLDQLRGFADNLVQLSAMADEASGGVGFFVPHLDSLQAGSHWVATVVRLSALHLAGSRPEGDRVVPSLSTVTLRFRRDLGAVLPKARTPAVGCTLRSATHHLAFLPPNSQIDAAWRLRPSEPQVEETTSGTGGKGGPTNTAGHARPHDTNGFNILVVPFPYRIAPESFRQHGPVQSARWSWFTIMPDWLPPDPPWYPETRTREFCCWIEDLVDHAQREGPVHAVVFPELSLSRDIVTTLADRLKERGIEFFVAGVGDDGDNRIMAKVFYQDVAGKVPTLAIDQRKHHRWKLDRSQLSAYGLAGVLNQADEYWEKLHIGRRQVTFHPFRSGSVLCFLICEDLARLEPCQSVVRAVGPNLLIALLMDGPQVAERWPARYATVLAEDPGSSVLTVSCLGMARLQERVGRSPNRAVALWKSPRQATRTIELGEGDQGVLLTLHCEWTREFSIDGRHDGGQACQWVLESAISVRGGAAPAWLNL